MAFWLLDTNICIYAINRTPGHQNLLHRIGQYQLDEILISTITLAELEFGIAKSQRGEANRTRFDLFIGQFEVVDFDPLAAVAYGPIRANLQNQGTPIGPLDFLLAAHALALDATLVTNNTREFVRVPGLRVEDWAHS